MKTNLKLTSFYTEDGSLVRIENDGDVVVVDRGCTVSGLAGEHLSAPWVFVAIRNVLNAQEIGDGDKARIVAALAEHAAEVAK